MRRRSRTHVRRIARSRGCAHSGGIVRDAGLTPGRFRLAMRLAIRSMLAVGRTWGARMNRLTETEGATSPPRLGFTWREYACKNHVPLVPWRQDMRITIGDSITFYNTPAAGSAPKRHLANLENRSGTRSCVPVRNVLGEETEQAKPERVALRPKPQAGTRAIR
jgi:hypothetical protein